ncbi:MAG: hypothetical protein HN348_05430 [Proteobacteria bacterium]|jgi:pimeloyl-ACP methyl ester carboxylesterase|nr:hypothetical protein [Pseudomonadota bacterium]
MICRVMLFASLTIALSACDWDSSGTIELIINDDTDTGGVCPQLPPESTDQKVCHVWECSEVDGPDCWECSFVPGDEGVDCELSVDGIGVCLQGVCSPVPDPAELGDLGGTVASHELHFETGIFDTDIPLTIYVPDGDGPFPVVVFTHGYQLGAADYDSYGKHLATWGYLVVMPDMPDGFGGANHVELAEFTVAILDWIDEIAASGTWQGKVDPSKLALAGHSMGGKISMLVSTKDKRPQAVFGIDPVDDGVPMGSAADYPSVTPELMGNITIPLGILGETTNATCSGTWCKACAPADDNFQQYYEHAASPALQIEIVGANHMSFLDNPNCGFVCSMCDDGTDDTDTTRMLTQRYLTAFLNVFVNDNSAYRKFLDGSEMDADVAAGLTLYESKNGF